MLHKALNVETTAAIWQIALASHQRRRSQVRVHLDNYGVPSHPNEPDRFSKITWETPEGVSLLAKQVRSIVGDRLNVLVLNAGISKLARIADHTNFLKTEQMRDASSFSECRH